MKKFKKIYIEITNMCNLNCSFCSNDNLEKKEISLNEFENILKKIDNYTDYLYLHVKGEPLLHSKFDDILKLCQKYNKKINITTNGTLLKKRLDNIINSNVRQINISLQSLISDKYLIDILESVKEILDKTDIQIVFRFWALEDNFNKFQKKIIDEIIDFYKLDFNIKEHIIKEQNIKLLNNLYLNKDIKFIWPNLNNEVFSDKGTCYGLRTHFGILVDGTIIPCCLDSKGVINLGNIFNDDLEDILNSKRAINMITNFQNNKICEELCMKCDFKDRF